jgi:hypothetical protein
MSKKGKHNLALKSSTRYKSMVRRTADPEQQFHEMMVAYKHSLPAFFKSSKYVLINKDGELLQEETEALRAQLSPNPPPEEELEETEVPFSGREEESAHHHDGRTENERLIQLIPKKFKENLVYKYKDKNTNERLKSVRTLKKSRLPNSDIKSEVDDATQTHNKNFLPLSPQHRFLNERNKRVSMLSELDSRFGYGNKSVLEKASSTRNPLLKPNPSDYDSDGQTESAEKETIDMVDLQNEAFSKMFVDSVPLQQIPQTAKFKNFKVFNQETLDYLENKNSNLY